jgi:beta-glucosidase
MQFPKNFKWGSASASYQFEGAAHEDGRGLSIWEMLHQKPNTYWSNQNGDVASDFYHRYKEDIAMMKQMGLQMFRMSIAWPRVLPEGTGKVNAPGLDFYDRLVDTLLAAGIDPYVTLFHWDYPLALYQQGGWLNRASADWFAEYTGVVVKRLGDRVSHWMTLNEPHCFLGIGHLDGKFAPGDRISFPQFLRAAHHTLLAHGKSVQVIRAESKLPCMVGMAPVGPVTMPATTSLEDIEAARKVMFSVTYKGSWNNTWWMDPVFFGHYPEDGLELFKEDLPDIRPGDMETIHQPLDFFGCNIYSGQTIRAGAAGKPEPVDLPQGYAMAFAQLPITPEALYWGPRFYFERYGKPVLITENGYTGLDFIHMDGRVHDPQRIDFIRRHLLQLRQAALDGVKLHGYFHWAIMDTFEWVEGYKDRFGLIYVDWPTQKRIWKDSAYYYKKLIATNGDYLDQDVPFLPIS